jgi:hypothetical protein
MSEFSKKISLYDTIHDFWQYGLANDNIDYILDKKYINYFNKIFFNYLVKSYKFNIIESLNQGNLKFHTNDKYKNINTIPINNIESSILEKALLENKKYKKNTKLNDIKTYVPLIIDTQKKIIDSLNNSNKYIYCLNQEMIHDSGSKINYNDPKNFSFFIESPGQKRDYQNNILPGFFNVYFDGINEDTIKIVYYIGSISYINTEITLNKNAFNTIKSINNNIGNYINKNQIKYETANLTTLYNDFFNTRTIENGLKFYNNLNQEIDKQDLIKKYSFNLIIEYSKKRYGDQLQVLSCQKEIIYLNENNNKKYIVYNPYFVSIDKMAIAFAINNNVNCIYDKSTDIATDYEIYTFNTPSIKEIPIPIQISPTIKKGGNKIDKIIPNINDFINDPYVLLDIAFPYNYKLFLNFPYYPVFTTKTQLRTLENDKILFMDEIYSKYDIFIYNNGILIYSLNNNIYWKNINEEEFNIVKEGINRKIIQRILKTQNIINTNIDNRILLYTINNPFKNSNLNIFFYFLQDLLRFEIDSLMNIEIKEQYFNEYKINDNTLTLYLPHNVQIYFLINVFYTKLIHNNTINLNILLNIINNYNNNRDYNDEIKKYLSSIWLFYINLPNNYYSIEESSETINYTTNYTTYNNIIYEAYNKYNNFIKELNSKNTEERIKTYIENNITINSIYLLIDNFINHKSTNNKPPISKTYKSNIKVKGGKQKKTRKNKK